MYLLDVSCRAALRGGSGGPPRGRNEVESLHEGKVVKVGQVQTRVAEVEVGVPQEEGVP